MTILVQFQLYFRTTGETSDQKKIAYVKSLLRGPAAKWITPFVEGQTETWTNYAGFKDALSYQFGEKDPDGKVRTKMEALSQGTDSVTEYWNQFRLIATEANMDNRTQQRQFLQGI